MLLEAGEIVFPPHLKPIFGLHVLDLCLKD